MSIYTLTFLGKLGPIVTWGECCNKLNFSDRVQHNAMKLTVNMCKGISM